MVKAPSFKKLALAGPQSPWMFNRIRQVIQEHKALTIEGWDDAGEASRHEAEVRRELRRALFDERAFGEIIATIIALAFEDIPLWASANWLLQRVDATSGVRARVGTAIAGAIVVGYSPLRDPKGPGCGFRRRKTA